MALAELYTGGIMPGITQGADLAAQATNIRGAQTRNRLADLALQNAPSEMQRQNRLLDLQIQGRESGLAADRQKQGITRLELLSRALSGFGDPSAVEDDAQANELWQAARRALGSAGVDVEGMPETTTAAEVRALAGLNQRDTANTVQSTYMDDKGNRVAVFRDGTTRALGKSGTNLQWRDDLIFDPTTGQLYAPGATPRGEGGAAQPPAQSGQPQAGGQPQSSSSDLTPEQIEERRRQREQREIELAGEKVGAEIRARSQAEKDLGKTKAGQKLMASVSQIDNVITTIDEAMDMTGSLTAGPAGTVLSALPGTPARDLEKQILTIKANIGFDRLQQMRDLSPTGGALGNVANQELDALQATISSLDTSQSPAQLRSNLRKIRMHYANWRDAVVDSYAEQYGESPPVAAQPPGEQDLDAIINKWSS